MTSRAAEAAVETERIGFFGKVPTHGDFVATGLGRQLQGTIDEWIRSGIHACEMEVGQAWEEMFATLPPWRFVMARSVWSSAPVAGVLLPSRDRVGRSFPLVIAARLGSYHGRPVRLCSDETWFIAAEALAETSTKRDFDVNALIAGLKRLRLPRGDDGEEAGNAADENFSLWWTIAPESRKVASFRTDGPPGPGDFAKLLRAPHPIAEKQRPVPIDAPPPAVPAAASEPQPAPAAQTGNRQTRSVHVEYAHATHAGTRLRVNADSLLVSERPSLFAVASGIGGEPGAADAAKLTTNMLAAADFHDGIAAMVQEVKGKLGRAHGLLQATPRSDAHRQIGAAVAAVTFVDDGFAVVWAGHVRCYLVRDGMMRCLTRDHVEIGMRFALSRYVGSQRQFVPEVALDETKDGDTVLICSAALPRVLGERAIAQILLDTPVAHAAEALVQDGLIANAADNLSAIVLRIAR